MLRPETVIGLPLPLVVAPPGEAVTVYELIAAPFDDGVEKLTTAERSPATASTALGASGTVADATGVTLADADEAEPVPTEFVAATVNV